MFVGIFQNNPPTSYCLWMVYTMWGIESSFFVTCFQIFYLNYLFPSFFVWKLKAWKSTDNFHYDVGNGQNWFWLHCRAMCAGMMCAGIHFTLWTLSLHVLYLIMVTIDFKIADHFHSFNSNLQNSSQVWSCLHLQSPLLKVVLFLSLHFVYDHFSSWA